MEHFQYALIGSFKELFSNAIPQKYFLVLIWAMAFDILTGVVRALKDRRFNSSTGIVGVLRKISTIAGCTFVSLLEYLLWQENVLAKTVVLIAVVYETTSVFENINQIDPRFGEMIQTIGKSISQRILSHADPQRHDARRDSR